MNCAIFKLEHMRYIIKAPSGVISAYHNMKYPQFNQPKIDKSHLYIICFKFDDKFHSDIRFGKHRERLIEK